MCFIYIYYNRVSRDSNNFEKTIKNIDIDTKLKILKITDWSLRNYNIRWDKLELNTSESFKK